MDVFVLKALFLTTRYALAFVVAGLSASSLVACSTGGVTAIAPQTAVPPALLSAAQARLLVYISKQADNSISIFRFDGKRIGRLTKSVNYPQGLFADAKGTLYVANRGAKDVLEFKRGADSPFKVLSDGGNQPEDVTMCPDGTVYVANILNAGGGGNITVYAHGSRNPTRTLNYDGSEVFFLACDAQGNLFATIVLGTTGTVVEFPSAQQSGAQQLPIVFGGNPAGIAIDERGNLLVADQGEGVQEFTEAGTPTGLQIATVGLNEIALSPNGKLLLGSTGEGGAQYTFPVGKLNHSYVISNGTPVGATFDPGNN
jgi:streptogramin lyase